MVFLFFGFGFFGGFVLFFFLVVVFLFFGFVCGVAGVIFVAFIFVFVGFRVLCCFLLGSFFCFFVWVGCWCCVGLRWWFFFFGGFFCFLGWGFALLFFFFFFGVLLIVCVCSSFLCMFLFCVLLCMLGLGWCVFFR